MNILFNDKKFGFAEVGEKRSKATYRDMHIKLNYEHGYAEVRGSIHKFKNYGKYNYDIFTMSDFLYTIKEFEEAFHLDKLDQKYFLNIEFGVNIRLSIDPTIVLESIIPYSGTGFFTYEQSPEYTGIKITHTKYYDIKLYDKSNLVSINKKDSTYNKPINILRLEIKIHGLKLLKNLASKTSLRGVTKMSDLVHPKLLDAFKNKLVEEFGRLLIVDREQLDIQALSPKNRELYNDAWKTSYWKQFKRKKNDPEKGKMKKREERALGKLKEIIFLNNDLKNQIEVQLVKSLTKIMDAENVAISSIWNNPRSEIFTWKKGDHNKYKERLLSRFPPDKELSKSIESVNSSILIEKKKESDMWIS